MKRKKVTTIIILIVTLLYLNTTTVFGQGGMGNICSRDDQCNTADGFVCVCGRCSYLEPNTPRPPCTRQNTVSWEPKTSTEIYNQNWIHTTTAVLAEMMAINPGGNPQMASGATANALYLLKAMYVQKPANTATALAIFHEKITGVKPAYAQSYGATALGPIAQLWSLSRDIALGGFVIIMVVIGIMLILRSKIDHRTIITIQQSLPKLIISLLLVIFSYAIVGLLIDLTNLISYLGLYTLQSRGFIAVPLSGTTATTQNRNDMINRLMSTNFFTLTADLQNVDTLIERIRNLEGAIWEEGEHNPIVTILKLDPGNNITRFIVWLAIFIAIIKTFFNLLTSYLSVTMKIIFAPFNFLFMAIPGSEETLTDWIREILSYIIVFPIVLFMLAFAAIFATQPGSITYYTNQTGTGLWGVQNTVLDGNNSAYWAPPALGDWYEMVGPLLSLGILLTMPKALNISRELIYPKSKPHRPSATEGAASSALQSQVARIGPIGGFMRG